MKLFGLGLLFISFSASATSSSASATSSSASAAPLQLCKTKLGDPATITVIHALANTAGPYAWIYRDASNNPDPAYPDRLQAAAQEISRTYFTYYVDVTPGLIDVCLLTDEQLLKIAIKICYSNWINSDLQSRACEQDMKKLLATL